MADDQPGSPKATYWTTFVVTMIALQIAILIAIDAVEHWVFHDTKRLGGGAGAVTVPSVIVAHLVASRVCRVMGVSRESVVVQTLRRGRDGPATGVTAGELRSPERTWLILARGMGCFCFVILALLQIVPSVPGTEIAGYLLAGGFGVAAFGCWLAYHFKCGFIARADADGIRGYPWRGRGVRTRTVAWADIETCEVTARRNAMGQWLSPSFVFKGKDGRVRLDILAFGAEEPQTKLFRDAVAHYLNADPAAAQITSNEQQVTR